MGKARIGGRKPRTIDLHHTAIWNDGSAGDLHQCCLAGAVFAEDGVHFSGAAINPEAIQRANAGIGLGYVFDTEHEIRHETSLLATHSG